MSRPISRLIPGVLAFAPLLLAANPAAAEVKLPALFSDHMVLQRNTEAPVWGWADPGEEVTVSIGGQSRTTHAGGDGRWQVSLGDLKAGGPHTLSVRGKNTLTINDVLAGEVWLGSGQSNMAWTVERSNNFEQEKAAANLPQIRMFTVARKTATTPQEDCGGKWVVCSPETVGSFSATAYFFGRNLHQKLGVPVGLINSSVGGTPVEAWTSYPAQAARPELKEMLASWEERAASFNLASAFAAYDQQIARWRTVAAKARAEGRTPPRQPQRPVNPRYHTHAPSSLFNGMIAPLIPFAMRGAIWYQGENNGSSAERGALYGLQLGLMIQVWRERWGQGDFPFAWVQLPNYTTQASGWPLVREGMLKTLALPNTGMTTNMDIGEHNDIHPKNKQDIGLRLSLWARANVYGEELEWSGPLPKNHRVHTDSIEVRFSHAEGLKARDGELRGFEIAGADKQWKPARARVIGRRVIVSSPEVEKPVAVRYSWAADPEGNLVNGAGLPASPFRTSTW